MRERFTPLCPTSALEDTLSYLYNDCITFLFNSMKWITHCCQKKLFMFLIFCEQGQFLEYSLKNLYCEIIYKNPSRCVIHFFFLDLFKSHMLFYDDKPWSGNKHDSQNVSRRDWEIFHRVIFSYSTAGRKTSNLVFFLSFTAQDYTWKGSAFNNNASSIGTKVPERNQTACHPLRFETRQHPPHRRERVRRDQDHGFRPQQSHGRGELQSWSRYGSDVARCWHLLVSQILVV